MKFSNLKKLFVVGIAFAGLTLVPNLRADVTLFLEGGSASRPVLYDRAANLFTNGSYTATGTSSSNVRRFTGTVSPDSPLYGYGTITLDINVANGAIAGLQALVNQSAGPGDTNVDGVPTVPTFVDSVTSPDAVGIDSIANNLVALQTYVVPVIYIKNSAFSDVNAITNLTQQQAVSLETSLNKATFYGGSSTNLIYFVGRNSQSAVRTEIDLNVYNALRIKTFTNNAAGLPVQDTSPDPGLTSGTAETTAVLALTNSIGTIAVQDLKGTLAPIAYNGVNYSVENVENGSYALWSYENYYYISKPNTGAPSDAQQAVLNAFYQSVTNASFQNINNPTFTNNFVPVSGLKVSRNYDGGPIIPNPNY
ncbi:MAG TPA: hypothetical protein VHG71_00515 [Verrucomicrobiae bacterium]|nr:hypothetical protein [Verrucomicrobiae bacterium]